MSGHDEQDDITNLFSTTTDDPFSKLLQTANDNTTTVESHAIVPQNTGTDGLGQNDNPVDGYQYWNNQQDYYNYYSSGYYDENGQWVESVVDPQYGYGENKEYSQYSEVNAEGYGQQIYPGYNQQNYAEYNGYNQQYQNNEYVQQNEYQQNEYQNNEYVQQNEYSQPNDFPVNEYQHSQNDYYSQSGYSQSDNQHGDYSQIEQNGYSENHHQQNDYPHNEYSQNDYSQPYPTQQLPQQYVNENATQEEISDPNFQQEIHSVQSNNATANPSPSRSGPFAPEDDDDEHVDDYQPNESAVVDENEIPLIPFESTPKTFEEIAGEEEEEEEEHQQQEEEQEIEKQQEDSKLDYQDSLHIVPLDSRTATVYDNIPLLAAHDDSLLDDLVLSSHENVLGETMPTFEGNWAENQLNDGHKQFRGENDEIDKQFHGNNVDINAQFHGENDDINEQFHAQNQGELHGGNVQYHDTIEQFHGENQASQFHAQDQGNYLQGEFHGENEQYHGENEQYHHGGNEQFYGENEQFHGENEQFHGENELYHGEHEQYHGENEQYHGENEQYHHGGNEQFHGENEQFHGENEQHEQYHGENEQFHGENEQYHGENEQYHGENEQFHSNEQYNAENEQFNAENNRFHGENEQYHVENAQYNGGNEQYNGENNQFHSNDQFNTSQGHWTQQVADQYLPYDHQQYLQYDEQYYEDVPYDQYGNPYQNESEYQVTDVHYNEPAQFATIPPVRPMLDETPQKKKKSVGIICDKCKRRNDYDANFCCGCGSPVKHEEVVDDDNDDNVGNIYENIVDDSINTTINTTNNVKTKPNTTLPIHPLITFGFGGRFICIFPRQEQRFSVNGMTSTFFPGMIYLSNINKFQQKQLTMASEYSMPKHKKKTLEWIQRQEGMIPRCIQLYLEEKDVASVFDKINDNYVDNINVNANNNIAPVADASIQNALFQGDRTGAVVAAMKQNAWAQAFLLASHVDKEMFNKVIVEYSKLLPFGSTRFLYQCLGGYGENAVNELESSNLLEQHWTSCAKILFRNKCTNDAIYFGQLGDALMRKLMIQEAHVCFLLGQSLDTRHVLVGTLRTFDADAFRLTEVYEFAVKKSFNYLHAYRLLYAMHLADMGLVDQALRYSETIAQSVSTMAKGTPYVHSTLLMTLKDLHERLLHMGVTPTSDSAQGWLQKVQSNFLDAIDRGLTRVIGEEVKTTAISDPSSRTYDGPRTSNYTRQGSGTPERGFRQDSRTPENTSAWQPVRRMSAQNDRIGGGSLMDSGRSNSVGPSTDKRNVGSVSSIGSSVVGVNVGGNVPVVASNLKVVPNVPSVGSNLSNLSNVSNPLSLSSATPNAILSKPPLKQLKPSSTGPKPISTGSTGPKPISTGPTGSTGPKPISTGSTGSNAPKPISFYGTTPQSPSTYEPYVPPVNPVSNPVPVTSPSKAKSLIASFEEDEIAVKKNPSPTVTESSESTVSGGFSYFGILKSLLPLGGSKAPPVEQKKPVRANLGQENQMVYDKELKRWVNRNDDSTGRSTAAPSADSTSGALPPSSVAPVDNRPLSLPPPRTVGSEENTFRRGKQRGAKNYVHVPI